MKHIQLFEGWEQMEMGFEMSPEQFDQEIDNAIATMSPEDAARHIKGILDSNPTLKGEKASSALPSMKKIANYLDSLTPDKQDQLRQELNPMRYEKARANSLTPDKKDQLQQGLNPMRYEKAKSILDSLLAGEISKEQALAALAQ
jgi:hypothetical protein